jgi:hypothetical protein
MFNPFRSSLLFLSLSAFCLPASAEVGFHKQILTDTFVSEGCAVGDFNRDGHLDVAAGRFLWMGPDFQSRREFTPERDNPSGPNKTPYDPATGYSDYFVQFSHDFTGDGWADLLVYGLPGEPALVFVNPQGKEEAWTRHTVFDVADGESPGLKDVNGDGKPDLLVHSSDLVKPPQSKGRSGGQLGFAEIDWTQPLGKARFRPITPKTKENDVKFFRYTHGYGAGDVNGDGRVDLLEKSGWYEQPADLSKDSDWIFHPAALGEGGAQMHVYDVNGDGRNDVITSYNAHGYGLGWFEQNADGSFTEHKLLGATPEDGVGGVRFSQIHAVELADINGDGLLDIVCGKRRWAHGPAKDADPMDDPVLYWFELRRDGKGGAQYTPHLIDKESGVGTQFWVGDLNKDGKTDMVTSNKLGARVFLQK